MLEWLFSPIFKTQTCVGDLGNVTCHVEGFGLSPIILVIIGAFIGILGLSSFINNRKEKKLEKYK